MKYCVIGPTYPFRGGIAHYSTLLVKHLRERHDVRFISYIKQYPKWLYPGNTAMDPTTESGVLQVACDRVLTPWNPLTWWQTYQIIKQDAPDVLILQWWTPFWSPMLFALTRLIHRNTKIRVIFLCHHMIPPDGGVFDWFLARRILWRGNAFVVMSEEDFALMRRALPWARIRGTTHPPYDIFSRDPIEQKQARAKLKLTPNDPVLLFFGFVRRYKGLRYLIEAMPQVRQQLPKAKLIVVGEFWEDERLYRELVARLGLTDCVQFYSKYVPNDDMSTYFSASDVVVMPYLEATQSGVAQLAIGFERAMIATNVGGMPDAVEDGKTGLLVPPADSGALAQAIVRYFQDDLRALFSENIRHAKASASWQPLVQLIEELSIPNAQPHTELPAVGVASPRVL